MIPKRMQEALNKQVTAELASAQLYMAMSAHLESFNLPGFANWMKIQSMEELTHAERLFKHIIQRRGRALMEQLPVPANEWSSPLVLAQEALRHEVEISATINNLVDLAHELRDHATHEMLQWFVAEQVEEEAQSDRLVQLLKQVGDSKGGLVMLDKQFAKRKFGEKSGMTE